MIQPCRVKTNCKKSAIEIGDTTTLQVRPRRPSTYADCAKRNLTNNRRALRTQLRGGSQKRSRRLLPLGGRSKKGT
jgi:hypothetical protein